MTARLLSAHLYNVHEELGRFDLENVLGLLERLLVPAGQQELLAEDGPVPPLLVSLPQDFQAADDVVWRETVLTLRDVEKQVGCRLVNHLQIVFFIQDCSEIKLGLTAQLCPGLTLVSSLHQGCVGAGQGVVGSVGGRVLRYDLSKQTDGPVLV